MGVTFFPASAASSVRAMRKIVSPSGIFRDDRAHLISHRSRFESRLGKERRDRAPCDRLVIHLGEEQSASHSVFHQRRQRFRDFARDDAARTLVFRKKNYQTLLPSP